VSQSSGLVEHNFCKVRPGRRRSNLDLKFFNIILDYTSNFKADNSDGYGVLCLCYRADMVDSVTEARKRQIARLDGAKPPTARKAMALAKSKA
jgi:hypothetical protein